MALDETLLHSAAELGQASLRFYAWAVPTVSLGYFQPARLLEAEPLLFDLPVVRRPTGGQTLVHEHEVTYALALPAGLGWQSGEAWTTRLHRIILHALAGLKVSAQALLGPGACSTNEATTLPSALCFAHPTCGDLLLGSAKITGSAQRKQKQALLQHGAILLAQSAHTPNLPGILELTGRELTQESVCTAVANSFRRETGWELVESAWSAEEREHAARLANEKYAQEAWTRKR